MRLRPFRDRLFVLLPEIPRLPGSPRQPHSWPHYWWNRSCRNDEDANRKLCRAPTGGESPAAEDQERIGADIQSRDVRQHRRPSHAVAGLTAILPSGSMKSLGRSWCRSQQRWRAPSEDARSNRGARRWAAIDAHPISLGLEGQPPAGSFPACELFQSC